jgi:hypothetical protein
VAAPPGCAPAAEPGWPRRLPALALYLTINQTIGGRKWFTRATLQTARGLAPRRGVRGRIAPAAARAPAPRRECAGPRRAEGCPAAPPRRRQGGSPDSAAVEPPWRRVPRRLVLRYPLGRWSAGPRPGPSPSLDGRGRPGNREIPRSRRSLLVLGFFFTRTLTHRPPFTSAHRPFFQFTGAAVQYKVGRRS